MSQGTVLDNGDFECPTHGKSRWKGDVRCAVCERTHNLYDPHRTADKCACGAELWSHGGSAKRAHGGKFLKPTVSPRGYLLVDLYRHGKRRMEYVHRLVALAFIQQPAGECVVNHKDFNPANNTAANLEWVSQAENLNYSRKAGRMPVTDKQRAAGASARLIAQQRRNMQ